MDGYLEGLKQSTTPERATVHTQASSIPMVPLQNLNPPAAEHRQQASATGNIPVSSPVMAGTEGVRVSPTGQKGPEGIEVGLHRYGGALISMSSRKKRATSVSLGGQGAEPEERAQRAHDASLPP